MNYRSQISPPIKCYLPTDFVVIKHAEWFVKPSVPIDIRIGHVDFLMSNINVILTVINSSAANLTSFL